jgi:hypothetical protein
MPMVKWVRNHCILFYAMLFPEWWKCQENACLMCVDWLCDAFASTSGGLWERSSKIPSICILVSIHTAHFSWWIPFFTAGLRWCQPPDSIDVNLATNIWWVSWLCSRSWAQGSSLGSGSWSCHWEMPVVSSSAVGQRLVSLFGDNVPLWVGGCRTHKSFAWHWSSPAITALGAIPLPGRIALKSTSFRPSSPAGILYLFGGYPWVAASVRVRILWFGLFQCRPLLGFWHLNFQMSFYFSADVLRCLKLAGRPPLQ